MARLRQSCRLAFRVGRFTAGGVSLGLELFPDHASLRLLRKPWVYEFKRLLRCRCCNDAPIFEVSSTECELGGTLSSKLLLGLRPILAHATFLMKSGNLHLGDRPGSLLSFPMSLSEVARQAGLHSDQPKSGH